MMMATPAALSGASHFSLVNCVSKSPGSKLLQRLLERSDIDVRCQRVRQPPSEHFAARHADEIRVDRRLPSRDAGSWAAAVQRLDSHALYERARVPATDLVSYGASRSSSSSRRINRRSRSNAGRSSQYTLKRNGSKGSACCTPSPWRISSAELAKEMGQRQLDRNPLLVVSEARATSRPSLRGNRGVAPPSSDAPGCPFVARYLSYRWAVWMMVEPGRFANWNAGLDHDYRT
jgi:hypothetical protein